MNWISVYGRLPKDGQRVIVWRWDEWQEARYSEFRKHFYRGSLIIEDVHYWAEVKMPGEE